MKGRNTYLNRTILAGHIDNLTTKHVGEKTMFRFTLCTQYAYKDRENNDILESFFINVTAWDDNISAATLKKSDNVKIEGRLRNVMYLDREGRERVMTEVLAHKVEVL